MKCLPPDLNNAKYESKLTVILEDLIIYKKSKILNSVHVKWWGECLGAFLRLPTDQVVYDLADDVIENYLRLCELVEFTLLNAAMNPVGSCFLNDPSSIFRRSCFRLQMVDHGGCKIGEMKLRFTMEGKILDKYNASNCHNRSEHHSLRPTFKDSATLKQNPKYGIAASLVARNSNLAPKTEMANDLPKIKNPNRGAFDPLVTNVLSDSSNGKQNTVPLDENFPHRQCQPYSALPRIIDYLLGKDLDGHQERLALSYLKQMSPGNHFVSAVTRSCEAYLNAVTRLSSSDKTCNQT